MKRCVEVILQIYFDVFFNRVRDVVEMFLTKLCCGDSLGLASVMILNLHFVSDVVAIIIELLASSKNHDLHKSLSTVSPHLIMLICIFIAFYGIFQNYANFMIPFMVYQVVIFIVCVIDIFSLICTRQVVFLPLEDFICKKLLSNYAYFFTFVFASCLAVAFYLYLSMIVTRFHLKLKESNKMKKSESVFQMEDVKA